MFTLVGLSYVVVVGGLTVAAGGLHPLRHVASPHRGREEEQGENGLPGLDYPGRDGDLDGPKPDEGKQRPGGSDEEDTHVLDLPPLAVRDGVHAEAGDHEQFEGGGADNCAGSEATSLKVIVLRHYFAMSKT